MIVRYSPIFTLWLFNYKASVKQIPLFFSTAHHGTERLFIGFIFIGFIFIGFIFIGFIFIGFIFIGFIGLDAIRTLRAP